MFESTTYAEKRSSLNEILLQQLLGEVLKLTDSAGRERLMDAFERYGRGQQLLRDKEAARLLGPTDASEGIEYVDASYMLDYLKANVGRTYFGVDEPTDAPEGSIGTAGFGKKFKDWLNELPAYDESVSKDIKTGFYKDTMTAPNQIPMLVLRTGDEATVVLFYKHVSVMTLNLARTPADYNWNQANHYLLRGEMYSYRGNIAKENFLQMLSEALKGQGVQLPLNAPEVVATDDGHQAMPADADLVSGGVNNAAEAPVTDASPVTQAADTASAS